jgi:type III pantothenate kinase
MSAAPLLLIDAGNTRVKWALVEPDALRPAGAVSFERRGVIELTALRRSDAPLRRVLSGLRAGTRVLACNVAGAGFETRLRRVARRVGLSAPRFARSSRSAAGIVNGYEDPWRLGTDRWVALIGAHRVWPQRALCLIGIGSALTIDLLDVKGRHRGGCIAPGPQMMIESLLRDTAGIRGRARLGSRAAIAQALGEESRRRRAGLFAQDTRAALLAGARQACAALIERATARAREELHGRIQLVVAGGAAETITPLLRLRHRREDDLVLSGLIVLAQAGEGIA